VIILTTRGARSGRLRKTPLMRVEHDGCYAIVASNDGQPTHPAWYYNLKHEPRAILQDGPACHAVRVRELYETEYQRWWTLATVTYPPFMDYGRQTLRHIPILLAQPVLDLGGSLGLRDP
jgi:deazaflavin-dependent oxidoreductase (nitroreductase family)